MKVDQNAANEVILALDTKDVAELIQQRCVGNNHNYIFMRQKCPNSTNILTVHSQSKVVSSS